MVKTINISSAIPLYTQRQIHVDATLYGGPVVYYTWSPPHVFSMVALTLVDNWWSNFFLHITTFTALYLDLFRL
jgi:hypothetical protein